jgi:ferredoxin
VRLLKGEINCPEKEFIVKSALKGGDLNPKSYINKPMICIHCGYCAQFCPHGVLKLIGKESN